MRPDPELSFATIIIGAPNARAVRSVRRALRRRRPGVLLLHGASGVGKTHLLHAAANELLERNPAARLTFMTGMEFTDGYLESLRRGYKEHRISARLGEHERSLVPCEAFLVDAMEDFRRRPAALQALLRFARLATRVRAPVILASGPEPRIERLVRAEPNATMVLVGSAAIYQRMAALRQATAGRAITTARLGKLARENPSIAEARGALERELLRASGTPPAPC